jgi:uncharacterized membrane protein YeaQ/YmgE (transglycosylase-associated protein family)
MIPFDDGRLYLLWIIAYITGWLARAYTEQDIWVGIIIGFVGGTMFGIIGNLRKQA